MTSEKKQLQNLGLGLQVMVTGPKKGVKTAPGRSGGQGGKASAAFPSRKNIHLGANPFFRGLVISAPFSREPLATATSALAESSRLNVGRAETGIHFLSAVLLVSLKSPLKAREKAGGKPVSARIGNFPVWRGTSKDRDIRTGGRF